jgi:hypothetical protein
MTTMHSVRPKLVDLCLRHPDMRCMSGPPPRFFMQVTEGLVQ